LSDGKKILYVMTSGVNAPERVYAPFILATAAVSSGIEATVYLLLEGVRLVKRGEAERIKLSDFPPFNEFVDQALQAGVKLEVCEQSCMFFGLKQQELIPGARVVGAATLNDRILEADAVLCF